MPGSWPYLSGTILEHPGSLIIRKLEAPMPSAGRAGAEHRAGGCCEVVFCGDHVTVGEENTQVLSSLVFPLDRRFVLFTVTHLENSTE